MQIPFLLGASVSGGGGGVGDVTAAGNNTFTGANSFTKIPGQPALDLGAGTALAVGSSYYCALSADRTLTISGTPVEGDAIELLLVVTGTPVLTLPSCRRVGQSDAVVTVLPALTAGLTLLRLRYRNAIWYLTDSIPGAIDPSYITGLTAALAAKASTSQTADFFAGFIATPSDKNYKIVVNAPHGGVITEIVTISESGTCTLTGKINTTALGGTANSVSSTEQAQAHASANTFVAGDDIVLTISANSTCVGLSFRIKYTRTLA